MTRSTVHSEEIALTANAAIIAEHKPTRFNAMNNSTRTGEGATAEFSTVFSTV